MHEHFCLYFFVRPVYSYLHADMWASSNSSVLIPYIRTPAATERGGASAAPAPPARRPHQPALAALEVLPEALLPGPLTPAHLDRRSPSARHARLAFV